jgi:hypothetical protein
MTGLLSNGMRYQPSSEPLHKSAWLLKKIHELSLGAGRQYSQLLYIGGDYDNWKGAFTRLSRCIKDIAKEPFHLEKNWGLRRHVVLYFYMQKPALDITGFK